MSAAPNEAPAFLRNPFLRLMAAAALAAGRHLRRDFGEAENLQRLAKGPEDFVTAADLKSEEILYRLLAQGRPEFGFLMEEGGEIAGTDKAHRWIIDPLDGTRNFTHALPHFAISLALEAEGVLVAGLIYQPLTGDIYSAERGGGAFLNGRRIRVSGRQDPSAALIATRGGRVQEIGAILRRTGGKHRHLGAVALDLAYLAAGKLDGFYARGARAWDLAAGLLLVREAGGIVSDMEGGKTMLAEGSILAGTPILHEIMLDAVVKANAAE